MPKAQDQTPAENTKYHVPNLERALTIIEHLSGHPEGATTSELATVLGFPNNSVFRIAMTLTNTGYLSRDADSKRFYLTRKFLAIGYGAVDEAGLLERSIDVMRDLRDSVGETTLLGTLLGTEGVVLEQVPARHPVKFMIDHGTRFPLHTAAPGKAMLAFLPDVEQNRIVNQLRFRKFTERTITSRAAFKAELAVVAEQGYATDRGEELEGLHCVAAPIFDHRGTPKAPIWITAPSFRLHDDEFETVGEQVRRHAQRISHRFGYDLV